MTDIGQVKGVKWPEPKICNWLTSRQAQELWNAVSQTLHKRSARQSFQNAESRRCREKRTKMIEGQEAMTMEGVLREVMPEECTLVGRTNVRDIARAGGDV